MKRVMVVDESEETRKIISAFLDDLPGFESCGSCTNAKEVISSLNSEQPDIILSSVLIFGMTGFRLADMLKTVAPSISVILMSEDKKHALQSHEKGVVGFLEKPINQQKFNKLIQNIH